MNDVATKHDGKKTMNYFLVTFILSPLTLGIAMLVWQHRLSQRVGDELSLRKIEYDYDEKCFWTWGVLGAIILIGPLVHAHKFLRAMNLISESHNQGK